MGNRSKRNSNGKPATVPATLTMKAAVCPFCGFVLAQVKDDTPAMFIEKVKKHSCECPKHPLVIENTKLRMEIAIYAESNPDVKRKNMDLRICGLTLDEILELIFNKDKDDDLKVAAVAYDDAIRACANDPDKMASHCTADGKTLDQLYAAWMVLARQS